MRRTLAACRAGFSVAAAVVLLSACGGSGKDDSASSSGSRASRTSADVAGSEFCTKAAAVESNLSSVVTDESDPASLPQALRDAVTEIRAIDPPSEISSDWQALADGVEQLAAALAS